jgi:hypothetical protein
MTIMVGTPYFFSRRGADAYYLGQGEDSDAVGRKLAAHEIHIGRPPLKPGERAFLIDEGTRWAVSDQPETVRLSKHAITRLVEMARGAQADRRRSPDGRAEQWFMSGTGHRVATSAIKTMRERGLIFTHYPPGQGTAGITDEGRAFLRALYGTDQPEESKL